MNKQLTVLIPTSPIPSHPSTAILDETISNIRKYTDAEILIMMDYPHASLMHRKKDYDLYKEAVKKNNLAGKYGDCDIFEYTEHLHQTGMTREVLSLVVDTPLIMFCEHDTSPIGDIPFQQICDFVENSPAINSIRFHIFQEFLSEHSHLMLDAEPVNLGGIPLVRTVQWSQRPNISKTNWYRMILETYFSPNEHMMIEDRMHSIVHESFKKHHNDLFGLSIYGPPGIKLRSYHSDGRSTDEKVIYG